MSRRSQKEKTLKLEQFCIIIDNEKKVLILNIHGNLFYLVKI